MSSSPLTADAARAPIPADGDGQNSTANANHASPSRSRRNVTFNVGGKKSADNSAGAGDSELTMEDPLSPSFAGGNVVDGTLRNNGSQRSSLSDSRRSSGASSAASADGAGTRRSGRDRRRSSSGTASSFLAHSAHTGSHTNHHSNNNGGSTSAAPFFLTKEDVQSAFAFFDVEGTGHLTMASLKPRLSAFYPNLTSKEYRFLLEDPVSMTSSGGTSSSVGNHHNANHSSNSGGGSDGNNSGFTADHLWELIDTYQKLYAGSVVGGTAAAASAAAAGGVGGAGGSNSSPGSSSLALHGKNTNGRGSANRSPRTPRPASHHAMPSNTGNSVAAMPATSAGSGGGPAASAVATAQIFDPVYEAFRVYDPTGRNKCVDTRVLAEIMARIGYGELNADELALLVRTADYDEDGNISLDDFRQLVTTKGWLGGGGGGGGGRQKK